MNRKYTKQQKNGNQINATVFKHTIGKYTTTTTTTKKKHIILTQTKGNENVFIP